MYELAVRAVRPLTHKGAFYPLEQRRRQAFIRAGLGRLFLDAEWTEAVRGRPEWLDAWLDKEFLFVHVPKTAGNAFRESLDVQVTHAPAVFHRRLAPEWFERAFSFGFCRNPYDRLVSAFHFLKHAPKNENDRRWGERNLSGYRDFRDFAEALGDARVRAAMLSRFHMMPQWWFLCDAGGRVLVKRVGRFESFAEDAEAIGARIGLPVRTQRINASPRGDWRAYYDPRSARLVERMYARDFEIFGYERERF